MNIQDINSIYPTIKYLQEIADIFLLSNPITSYDTAGTGIPDSILLKDGLVAIEELNPNGRLARNVITELQKKLT